MQPLEAMEPPSPQAGVQPPAHSRRRTARFQRRSRPITALRCVGVGGCLCRAPQGRPCVCANDGDGGKCLTFTCIASWVRTLKVACKAGRASAPTTATSERRERQASERGFPPPFASLGRGGRGGRGACAKAGRASAPASNDGDKREARATRGRESPFPPPLRLSWAGGGGRLSGVADDGGGAGLLKAEVEALLKVLRLNHRRLVLAATHTPYPPPPTPLHTQPRPPHPILSPAHPIHTQPHPPHPRPTLARAMRRDRVRRTHLAGKGAGGIQLSLPPGLSPLPPPTCHEREKTCL